MSQENQNNLNDPLDENSNDFQSIFNLAPVAIVVIDLNGIIQKLNGRICDWLNYKLDDAIGKNIFVLPFLTKKSKMTILEKYSERLEGAESVPYEIEFKTKDGDVRSGMVCETQINDPKDKKPKTLVVIADITGLSRKEVVDEGCKSSLDVSSFYKAIFESSVVSIIVTDINNDISSWNNYTENLLGLSADDLNSKSISKIYTSQQWEKIKGFYQSNTDNSQSIGTKLLKGDGKELDVDLTLTILKDEQGRTTGTFSMIKDVSRSVQAQGDVIKAQKMRNDFLSMLSHELKTPLMAIQGSIGIVLDGSAGEVNEEQVDFLQTAKRNLDRLDCLIDDVLYYQKLEIGETEFEMEEGNFNDLIEGIRHECVIMTEGKNIEFKTELAEDLPRVKFDQEKITKVIINLIENAVKFTKEGSVTVTTSCPKGVVCVAVKDTGVGIKKESIGKLFQVFGQLTTGARRETGNTGLGLVIVKSIIEKHRGKIWVDSEFEKGTTFFFLLPAA